MNYINAIIYLNDERAHDQMSQGECSAETHGFDNNHGHATN